MVWRSLVTTMPSIWALLSVHHLELLERQRAVSPVASRLWGLALLVFGAYGVIYRQKLARKAVDFYRKWIGVSWPERVYEIGYYIAGVSFTVIGALLLFGIIRLG